jgi:cyclophilin family peptidyl-prolyl cis-trans isomerase
MRWILALSVMLIAAACTTALPADTPAPAPTPTPTLGRTSVANSYSAPPAMTIDSSKRYVATMETAKGNIVIELFAADAPVTANNFVFLSREGYYDNTTFHRVLTDFMAQGGDPTGTGSGGPGYQFADEFSAHLRHDSPGILSMANAGPGTNGSQFFLTHVPTPHLDGRHTVFGKVTEGLDVLLSLTPRDPNQRPNFEGDTLKTVTIQELDQ